MRDNLLLQLFPWIQALAWNTRISFKYTIKPGVYACNMPCKSIFYLSLSLSRVTHISVGEATNMCAIMWEHNQHSILYPDDSPEQLVDSLHWFRKWICCYSIIYAVYGNNHRAHNFANEFRISIETHRKKTKKKQYYKCTHENLRHYT